MARITLRDYNNEINDLIDHGQIEEAISHCRHILQDFPKCVDTYRLLGKAYLEQHQYGDAGDILQRVLSSVPNDFVSQIGMSIIREDEGNLDAAIYHMELAFESQPSNHAIQDELRRLFAKRDGMEPPRIRLTRGALARMYAHGNLFEQAISEIQAALAEDPKRFDLQTLLANMLNQVDKKVEAAETCTRIIEKLPYNMAANRLLATILQESGREEEAEKYQKRWNDLDPYAAHISKKFSQPEQVPDDRVTVEREDWEPSIGGDFGDVQPAWASSTGSELGGSEPQQEVPDWLSEPGDGFGELPSAEPGPMMDADGGDWMTEDATSTKPPFGSPEASSPVDEWMADFSPPPSSEAGEPAPADDWMSEFSTENESPIEADSSADWLSDTLPAEEKPVADEESTIPDFMQQAGWGESDGETADQPVAFDDQPGQTLQESEIPDWIQEMAPSDSDAPAAPDLGALSDVKAEADPDWLNSLDNQSQEETPEWFGELSGSADETVPSATPPTQELVSPGTPPTQELVPPGTPPSDSQKGGREDVLAGGIGQPPSPVPSDSTEDLEWPGPIGSEEPVGAKADSGGLEIPERDADPAGYLAGDFGEDDTDDWLASLGSQQPASEQTDLEEEQFSDKPDEPVLFDEEQPREVKADSGNLEIPEREANPAGYLAGDFGEDDTDDWLASLAASQGGSGEMPAAMDEEPADEQVEEQDDFGSLQAEIPPAEKADSSGLEIPERDADPAGYLAGDFGEDDTDDWLASLAADQQVGQTDELPHVEMPSADAGDFSAFEATDWPAAPETAAQEEAAPADSAPSAEVEDEGMAWLEGLAADQGAAEEELVTSQEQRESLPDDFTPDFLSDQEAEPSQAAEEDLADLFGEAEPSPGPTAEEGMDWLAQMGEEAAETSAASDDLDDLLGELEEVVEQPVIEDEDDISMDWLESISKEASAEAAAGEPPTEQASDNLADLFGEALPSQEAAQPDQDTMDWLQDLPGAPAPSAEGEPATDIGGDETLKEDELTALFGEDLEEKSKAQSESEALDWFSDLDAAEVSTKDVGGEETLLDADISDLFTEEETMDWFEEQGRVELQAAPSAEVEDEDDLSALFEELDEAAAAPVEPAPEMPGLDTGDLSIEWEEAIESEGQVESAPAEAIPEASALDDLRTLADQETAESPPDIQDLEPEKSAPLPMASDELDEGLAWLESLAAKQGVAEEELVTSPEERTSFEGDRTPDWLQDFEEEEEKSQPQKTAVSADLEDLSLTPPDAEQRIEPPASSTEDILEEQDELSMGWLDTISQEAAEEAGLTEESFSRLIEEDRVLNTSQLSDIFGEDIAPAAPSEPPADESETLKLEDALELEEEQITEEDETAPDWMKIIEEDQAAKPVSTGSLDSLPADAFPEFEAPEEEVVQPPVAAEPSSEPIESPAVEMAPPADVKEDVLEDQDDFSMDWLESISQEAAAEAGAGEEEPAQIPDQRIEEPPDWLSSIEDEEEVLTGSLDNLDEIFGSGEQAATPVEEVEPEEPPAVLAEAPDWLQEIAEDKPSPIPEPEQMRLSEFEETPAEEQVPPQEEEPEAEIEPELEPEPEPEDEPAAEIEPEVETELKAEVPVQEEPQVEAAAVEPPAEQPKPEPAASKPSVDEAVASARQALQDGKLESAIKQFNQIIKKGKNLKPAIEEIKEALRRHPVNVELWQVLGDAYMKDDNLQDALDAYSKAEKLLR